MNPINFALLNLALSRISLLSRWVGEEINFKDQLSPAEAERGAELDNFCGRGRLNFGLSKQWIFTHNTLVYLKIAVFFILFRFHY